MISALLYGFLAGVILSFGFGSVFFALIQNSIDFGYKSGVVMALGVVVCDLIAIFLALNGTQLLPNIQNFELYARIIGAVLLIVLGLSNIFHQNFSISYPQTKRGKFGFFFVQGFLLNGVNPVNFFAWLALCSALKGMNYTFLEQVAYLLSSICAIFVTESLIAYFAHRIKSHLSVGVIQKIKTGTGFVFFLIAGLLLKQALE